jgi:hypothetical protein
MSLCLLLLEGREHLFFQRGKERRLLKRMKKHGKFFNEDIDTAPV